MGDANVPTTPPNPSDSEKPKEKQQELIPSSEEEKKDEPTLDIPAPESKPEPEESPIVESEEKEPTLDIPTESEGAKAVEDALTPSNDAKPTPPDMTPPVMPPAPEQAEAAADDAGEEKKAEDDQYEMPPALGDLIGQNLKDLGLGGQIALGGGVLCLLSSFFWSWGSKAAAVEWFIVMLMLLMSIETITLVCLQMVDKFAGWRPTLRLLVFIPGIHLTVFSLLAVLLRERGGSVFCLIGGIVVCIGAYIAEHKSRAAAAPSE